MSEEEKKEGEEAATEKPKGKKKLLIIVIVVVLLLGGVGAFFLLGKKTASKEEENAEKPRVLATLALPNFIVNLSETNAFLKVSLLVEYDVELLAKAEAAGGGGEGEGHAGGEKEANIPPLFTKRMPMIRDNIIKVLASKKSDELLISDGKEKLKEELIDAINEGLGAEEGPIVSIYFTDFIIQ